MGDLDAARARLFVNVVAPLVLGGDLRLERPYGARAAHFLDAAPEDPAPGETALRARVDEARLRGARRLTPLDRVPALGPTEWALAACLHDLLQMLHPRLAPGAPRLLTSVEAILARTPAPATLAGAVARHTVFARVLSVTRTDTTVRFWAGRRRYLGAEPPARALAWPKVRKVQVQADDRLIFALAETFPGIAPLLARGLARFLATTPITDLATAGRANPRFDWNAATLGVVGTSGGARLAARALARGPSEHTRAEGAIAAGHAARRLAENGGAEANGELGAALAFLGELALDRAAARFEVGPPAPRADPQAAFALAVGSTVAALRLRQEQARYPEPAFERLRRCLEAESHASAEGARWTAPHLRLLR